jgi:dCMP deaminase
LHAEENAFLQLAKYGNSGIEGGKLFTTASPCELCSKKAYQLGITDIVFIDPYPGIAIDHVLNVGTRKPNLIQFYGAVGRGYHQLYEALISYKDELNYLKS